MCIFCPPLGYVQRWAVTQFWWRHATWFATVWSWSFSIVSCSLSLSKCRSLPCRYILRSWHRSADTWLPVLGWCLLDAWQLAGMDISANGVNPIEKVIQMMSQIWRSRSLVKAREHKRRVIDDLLRGVRVTQKMPSARSRQVKLKQTRLIWKLPSRRRHRSQGCRSLPMKKIKEMTTCEVVWRITASSSLVPFPCFSCWVKMCACCHCGVEVLNNFVGLSHGSSLHCNWNHLL